MKMTKMLAVLVAILSGSAAHAAEDGGAYIGGFALLGFADNSDAVRDPVHPTPIDTSSDTAGINGGAGVWLGYDFAGAGAPIRTELAGTWRYRHDTNISFTDSVGGGTFGAKANIETIDLMASVLYDLPVDWALKPYVGGGVGVARLESDSYLQNPAKVNAGTESQWNFAWQLQGGVSYALTQSWDFRVDYRYIDMGSISTARLASGDRFTTDIDSHDFRIGAAYSF